MRWAKIKYNTEAVTLRWTTECPRKGGRDVEDHELVSDDRPHADFVRALHKLTDDVLAICELPTAYGEALRVQSVTFTYNEKTGDRGAVVTALRSLAATTAPLVLNTPHLLEDGDGPAMSHGMVQRLHRLAREAQLYIDGKREQADLFAEDNSTVTFELAGHEPVTMTSRELSEAASLIGTSD